ncbi:MAG: heme-degrading monooxygenase HmoA [Sulfurimonas sp.]|jgi:heme-degrading monooxygenase HmoA
MAFVVFEIYKTDKEKIERLKKTLFSAAHIFEDAKDVLNVDIYENTEDFEIIASSTWTSKESFNKFLKCSMLELLKSDMMKTIKECVSSIDMKTYNKVEK